MKELSIDAEIKNIRMVTEFIDKQLEEHNCHLKAQTQLDIAIDELFSNIARYAYAPDTGTVSIALEITENPKSVKITLIDNGVPYKRSIKASRFPCFGLPRFPFGCSGNGTQAQ